MNTPTRAQWLSEWLYKKYPEHLPLQHRAVEAFINEYQHSKGLGEQVATMIAQWGLVTSMYLSLQEHQRCIGIISAHTAQPSHQGN